MLREKKVKMLAVFLLFAPILGYSGQTFDLDQNGLLKTFKCDSDMEIEFLAVLGYDIQRMGAKYAMATKLRDTGHRQVIVDSFDFGRQPAKIQYLIAQHECAHHIMGHLERQHQLKFEQEADCYAAKKAKPHFTREDWLAFFKFIDAQQAGFTNDLQNPAYAPTYEHSPNNRITRTKQCIDWED